MHIFRNDRPLTPSWNLLGPSMRLVGENIWSLFYLSFLPSLAITVGLVLAGQARPETLHQHLGTRAVIGLCVALLGGLASILAGPGIIYLQIKAIEGARPSVADSFKHGLPYFLPLAVTLVCAVAILLAGLILVIPGLILLRGFYLVPYFVVDQKLGPLKALRASLRASRTNAGYIWGTIGVSVVFALMSINLDRIPVIGYLLSLSASYPYFFAPALRYGEIVRHIEVRPAA